MNALIDSLILSGWCLPCLHMSHKKDSRLLWVILYPDLYVFRDDTLMS